MKTMVVCLAVVLLLAGEQTTFAQGGSSAERRAFREYTSPQELVSIAPSTSLDKAIAAISEVSQKFIGKIVIDTEHRTMPINVDIQGLQWRDALEAICRKNDLWYTEFENYLQLTGGGGTQEGGTTGQQAGKAGVVPGGGAGTGGFDIPREYANFRSREVKISAAFFEVNLSKLEEVGIDWSFMKSTSNVAVAADATFGSRVSSDIFKVEVTPKLSYANMTFLARFFSNYDAGEVLSSPQLVVRSGEEGRIQVGQDFSIKERDFAGNLIDKFYSAGAIIKIKPQVITEQGVNFVHLVADVERSSVAPGQVSTIINKAKATTNVLLLDGEETLIGGLYETQTTETRSGVPFLKDLPWYIFGLRYIFGYQKTEDTKKELIIVLKVELVPTLQERITQKAKQENIFDRWLSERLRQEQSVKGSKE
jgi:general secretion pathway protein D